MEPTNPLDRKLGDMQHDIEVLQRRVAELLDEKNGRDRAERVGAQSLGDILVLVGRRLRGEL